MSKREAVQVLEDLANRNLLSTTQFRNCGLWTGYESVRPNGGGGTTAIFAEIASAPGLEGPAQRRRSRTGVRNPIEFAGVLNASAGEQIKGSGDEPEA